MRGAGSPLASLSLSSETGRPVSKSIPNRLMLTDKREPRQPKEAERTRSEDSEERRRGTKSLLLCGLQSVTHAAEGRKVMLVWTLVANFTARRPLFSCVISFHLPQWSTMPLCCLVLACDVSLFPSALRLSFFTSSLFSLHSPCSHALPLWPDALLAPMSPASWRLSTGPLLLVVLLLHCSVAENATLEPGRACKDVVRPHLSPPCRAFSLIILFITFFDS